MKPTSEQIDRLFDSARRTVGKLVRFLGDEDPGVLRQVAGALAEIGPFAVGPLAAALPRAESPHHRAAIIGALLTFGPQAKVPVVRALTRAIEKDPDPHVRAAAQAALSSLMTSDLIDRTSARSASKTAGPTPTSATAAG